MKLIFVTIALGMALPPATAQAHDVRLSDGSLWEHDCDTPYFTESAVRNVSVTVPQLYECEAATWPDIPVACVAAEEVQSASAQ